MGAFTIAASCHGGSHRPEVSPSYFQGDEDPVWRTFLHRIDDAGDGRQSLTEMNLRRSSLFHQRTGEMAGYNLGEHNLGANRVGVGSHGPSIAVAKLTRMARLFAALRLDDHAVKNLRAQIERVGRPGEEATAVPEENWHITLVFLGEVSQTQQKLFLTELAKQIADFPTFTLRLRAAGSFPQAGLPGQVWVGVDEADGYLPLLAQHCRAAATAAGIKNDNRRYQPHLTIYRGKPSPDEAWFAGWRHYQGPEFIAYRVDLLASVLTPQKAVYQSIATLPLGEPKPQWRIIDEGRIDQGDITPC